MMPFQRYNKGTLGGGAAFYGNFVTDGVVNTAIAQNLLVASLFEIEEPVNSRSEERRVGKECRL